jgi:hypothetical protein
MGVKVVYYNNLMNFLYLLPKTLSTLIKVTSLKKHLRFPPLLFSPLGLCIQAIQHGILITLVYALHFNYLCK